MLHVLNSQNLSISMESDSSFSLGLSHLDVKDQTNTVFEFVPETFDNEDPNFAENKPKHRNDPTKMKKLMKISRKSSKNQLQDFQA